MNKTELVRVVADKTGVTLAAAGDAVNAVFEAVTDALVNGEEVAILGFGTFKVNERAARTARNPQTGAMVEVEASKAPAFKASKALKDKLN